MVSFTTGMLCISATAMAVLSLDTGELVCLYVCLFSSPLTHRQDPIEVDGTKLYFRSVGTELCSSVV